MGENRTAGFTPGGWCAEVHVCKLVESQDHHNEIEEPTEVGWESSQWIDLLIMVRQALQQQAMRRDETGWAKTC